MSLVDAPAKPDTRDPQARAADPTLSVFVTANAGSGKTKTLIDRVARLLLAGAEPGELTYLEVTGRRPAGREEVRAAPGGDGKKILESQAAVDEAVAGLARLVAHYRDPSHGYISRTAPQFVRMYVSDYDHLARVFEWSTSGEGAEE